MRKNILITGASSGLGRGMAREFVKLGCNLALCARRTEREPAAAYVPAWPWVPLGFLIRRLPLAWVARMG